ncbi:hypothetical protein NHX12_019316 [Muraenolepis orangiensis]|uniref:Uncharacterized protein n=1 Tax=Muraenolepis orangiensis TaxID=630683 RepID=A0A9Q0IWH5_9TELE|nr:hypothetical protein NHX12_019316 [Muraenolepis orangiensis]
MHGPAPVEIAYDCHCLRFLITHNPTDGQLGRFIERPLLVSSGTEGLRGAYLGECAATYDKTPLEQEGIQVLDWLFDDGSAPRQGG